MKRILLLPGDGIGPEVTWPALELLQTALRLHGRPVPEVETALIGGEAIDATGDPLPPATVERARASSAVFLGAVGGPRWDLGPRRPEEGLLGLRKALGVFANLRPIRLAPDLGDMSPLRPERLGRCDFLIVRELTGGLYFGARGRTAEGAFDTLTYTRAEVARVAHVAFRYARERGLGRVQLVDKANVLESSRLWREVVREVALEYPEVALEVELVDSCAFRMVKDPGHYTVILTENLFGDILSDLGAGIVGSLGLLPSASLGEGGPGLFEPVHGSAPDIAGTGQANPMGAMGAMAMLARWGLGEPQVADAMEAAVDRVVARGVRTRDLSAPGEGLDTGAFTAAVVAALERSGIHA